LEKGEPRGIFKMYKLFSAGGEGRLALSVAEGVRMKRKNPPLSSFKKGGRTVYRMISSPFGKGRAERDFKSV
jgi:hypothetical protein